MSHEVIWTKLVLERFISQAGCTPLEEHVMRTRAAGWSRTKQQAELHISAATLDRTIRVLKCKYDAVQKYDPLLPPRKHSAKELWMDQH